MVKTNFDLGPSICPPDVTFEQVVDKGGKIHSAFEAFVLDRFGYECLYIYYAALDYKNRAADMTPEQRCELGKKIVEDSVAEDATYAFDLEDDIKIKLQNACDEESFSPTTFNKVVTSAKEVLMNNFFHKFVEYNQVEAKNM